MPSPHSDAVAIGYTKNVFLDDFDSISTIDVTNSKTAGFNWYTGTFPYNNTTLTPTAPSEYSVSSSILTITNNSNTGLGGYQFGTRAYLGTNSPRTLGYPLFTPGGYWEWKFAFDSAPINSSGWPALWLQDVDGTLALADHNASLSPVFGELDIFEATASGGSFVPETNVIQWVNLVGTYGSKAIRPNFGSPTWNTSTYHTIGMLWIPMKYNNGTGVIKRYFDGVHLSDGDLTYTSNTPPSPDGTQPNGTFSIADSGQYIMFMDTGAVGSPETLKVDYVSVWQRETVTPLRLGLKT